MDIFNYKYIILHTPKKRNAACHIQLQIHHLTHTRIEARCLPYLATNTSSYTPQKRGTLPVISSYTYIILHTHVLRHAVYHIQLQIHHLTHTRIEARCLSYPATNTSSYTHPYRGTLFVISSYKYIILHTPVLRHAVGHIQLQIHHLTHTRIEARCLSYPPTNTSSYTHTY